MIKTLSDVPHKHQVLVPLIQLDGHSQGFYVNGVVYVPPGIFSDPERAGNFKVTDVEFVYGDERENFFGIMLKNILHGPALEAHIMRLVRTDGMINSRWLPHSVREDFNQWIFENINVYKNDLITREGYIHPNTLYKFYIDYRRRDYVTIASIGDFHTEHLELERALTTEWLSDLQKEQARDVQTFGYVFGVIALAAVVMILWKGGVLCLF